MTETTKYYNWLKPLSDTKKWVKILVVVSGFTQTIKYYKKSFSLDYKQV